MLPRLKPMTKAARAFNSLMMVLATITKPVTATPAEPTAGTTEMDVSPPTCKLSKGRLTDEVNKLPGCVGVKFSIENGWDFSRPADRKKFIKLITQEEPDDIHISAECKLWNPLQKLIASRSEEAKKFLKETRAENHDAHLVFCPVDSTASW